MKVLLPDPNGYSFSFQTLAVAAPGIRSLRLLCGSPVAAHSMFYDNLTVTLSNNPGTS